MSADYRKGCLVGAALGITASIAGLVAGATLPDFNGALVPLGALLGCALYDWRQLRRGE